MANPSAPASVVLHVLRAKGAGAVDALADATGLEVEQVVLAGKELAEDGLVAPRPDAPGDLALTAAGRQAAAALVAVELDEHGRAALEAGYRRFLAVNPELLATCTAWQLRDGPGGTVINDHADPAWDDAVLDRLDAVHDAAEAVLGELAAAAPRFDRYRHRLARARDRVRAGDHAWFTRPGIDSYHTVWFELHEDLLATLGVERSMEGRS